MEGTKGLLASSAFWGSVISILGKAAVLLGWDLGDVSSLSVLVGSFIGDAIALWGRLTAIKKIDRLV